MINKNFNELKELGFSDGDIKVMELLDSRLKVHATSFLEITDLLTGHSSIAEQVDWLSSTFGSLVKKYKVKSESTYGSLHSKYRENISLLRSNSGLSTKVSEADILREIIKDPEYIKVQDHKNIVEKWYEYFHHLVFTMSQRENVLKEASVNLRAMNNANID